MIANVMLACVNGGGGRMPRTRQAYPASDYAAYQIRDTLRMVEPIKLEPGRADIRYRSVNKIIKSNK